VKVPFDPAAILILIRSRSHPKRQQTNKYQPQEQQMSRHSSTRARQKGRTRI